MIDVLETQKHQPRGRVHAQGHRTDDGTAGPLLIVHEVDGSWSFGRALPSRPADPRQICPTCQRAEPSPRRDE